MDTSLKNLNDYKKEGFGDEEIANGLQIFQAAGCSNCTDGYKGRTGIYEVMPVTEEIGRVIMAGGSAVDAAVAVQMVLTLVEPQSSGIGGGAFLLHWDGQRVQAFDGREVAPAAVDERLFLDAQGTPLPFGQAVASGRAVGVPMDEGACVGPVQPVARGPGVEKVRGRRTDAVGVAVVRNGSDDELGRRLLGIHRRVPHYTEDVAKRVQRPSLRHPHCHNEQ